MKNYRKSDYAINKYAQGIVYQFANKIIEITLEDYLAENPDKSEKDFNALKSLSDEIYLFQVRADNLQSMKNVSMNSLGEIHNPSTILLDDQYIEMQEKQHASQVISQVLKENLLTEIQRRRFEMYICQGFSTRQIAIREGTTQRAIVKSIHASLKKIKRNFPF